MSKTLKFSYLFGIINIEKLGGVILNNQEPLAYRMRPKTIEDIVGQDHILNKDKLLYRAIKADKLTSMILYGPPGSGKTSLASVIANMTFSHFMSINATTAGKEDMKNVIEEAKTFKDTYGKKTILFLDEIHRFNKAQQDFLLPFVEKGNIILIGATTENPFFEVNNALISRSIIFQLKQIEADDVAKVLKRAINDKENGLGNENIEIDEDALMFLANLSNGDIRRALNGLELAVLTTDKTNDKVHITLEIAKECIQENSMRYDKDGDEHYNAVSAFIKSMRGSNPDAAIYYLARMIKSGEDPKFIARRIVICAAEDVGLADPNALVVATNAFNALERIGMPEGRIILAEAVDYIARAPKDNSSYLAIDKALDLVEKTGNLSIPVHLRDSHYKGASKLGNGIGYLYPHDYPGHFVEQQYLPDEIKDKRFF